MRVTVSSLPCMWHVCIMFARFQALPAAGGTGGYRRPCQLPPLTRSEGSHISTATPWSSSRELRSSWIRTCLRFLLTYALLVVPLHFHPLTSSRPKLASYPKGLVRRIIALAQGLDEHVQWIWLNISLQYPIPGHLSRRMSFMDHALDHPFPHTPEARRELAKEK